MKDISKTAVIVLLSVLMTILVVSIVPVNGAAIAPARADGLGGVISSNVYPPVIAGTTRYTTSLTTSSAIATGLYGSAQIMLNNIVTGSQTVTVTPQFSLQSVPCANVTQWFSATTYLPYQPYSIVSSATTVTESVGAWTTTPVIDAFTLTGSGVAQREISVQGQCMRVLLNFSNAGQSYTPTLTIRGLNRN